MFEISKILLLFLIMSQINFLLVKQTYKKSQSTQKYTFKKKSHLNIGTKFEQLFLNNNKNFLLLIFSEQLKTNPTKQLNSNFSNTIKYKP